MDRTIRQALRQSQARFAPQWLYWRSPARAGHHRPGRTSVERTVHFYSDGLKLEGVLFLPDGAAPALASREVWFTDREPGTEEPSPGPWR